MDIPSQRSFAAIFLVACNCLCGKTVLYVSVEGDDANPGTAARPFASIDAARDAVRELKRSGRADGPITVKLGSGRFRLDTALEFYPRDSGTEDAPVRYEGAGRGRTIVTGGVTVDGWREEADGTWSARVEAVKQQKVYFNQLFVNGRRARRAVTPNKFYLRTAGPLKALGNRREAKKDNSTKVGFRFTEGDLSAWQNPDDVMITLYHSWTASLHWISAIDFDRGTVRFTNRSGWPVSYWERRQRYQVENFREALDSPGEWYLDRKTGILEYFPLPGENMNTSSAVAPVLTELVRFQGDPENGAFVEYITFKGISFMHAGWRFDRTKPVDGQAHCSPKSSAIKAYGLRYSCFEDCEIAHVGSHAIWLEKGCQENRISHCHIHDAGGGGVYIGEGGKVSYMPPEEALQVRGNVVDNTIIHDITHVLHGSIGIWVGSSSENTLSHNDISDFDYTGISVGWSWSRKEEIFQHSNIIEYNRVHHNGKEILSDNGGIYVLGCSPGSVIRGNLIHDVRHYPYINASRGIYLDGNTSRYLIENNVCCRIGSYGITVKGEYNTVRNNIFAFCGECGLDRRFKAHAKSFDYDQDLFRSNVVLQKISNMTLGYFYEKWTDIDRNLYWSTQFGNAVVFNDISARLLEGVPRCSDVSFEEWQALGRDTHSLVADPRFVDPHGFDFRTRGDSPVSEIGFEPILGDSAGLYGDEAWTNLPKSFAREPVQFAPPPPEEKIDYDFERFETGEVPVTAGTISVQGDASVAVIHETAAEGEACLKFSGAPGTKSWQPHWFFRLKPKQGKVKFSCNFMNDPDVPATVKMEFRDWSGQPWLGGPAVTVRPDGTLTAAKRKIGRLPPGRWVKFEIEFEQGQGTPAVFNLSIVGSGMNKQIEDIPFVSDQFGLTTWFGFSELNKGEGIFYLDNVRLETDQAPDE